MRKFKTSIGLMIFVLFSAIVFISCNGTESSDLMQNSPTITQGDTKTMSKLSQDDLIKTLSNDANFRALSDMIVFFENMPKRSNYVLNFNKEVLTSQKDDNYFSEMSGYSSNEVANTREKVNNLTVEIIKKYPELKDYSKTDLYTVIESASNIYYDGLNLGSKVKCSTCGKIGRAKMVFYTLTGAFTCSAGGIWGAWACGTAGFALAGYEALACLEDCQK